MTVLYSQSDRKDVTNDFQCFYVSRYQFVHGGPLKRQRKANIVQGALPSGAAYQCKHHAASCINKFKANIDQGEFPERSKHHVASCVNRFTVQ